MAASSPAGDTQPRQDRDQRSTFGIPIHWFAPVRSAIALLVLSTLAAYADSLHGAFIFDDLNDIVGKSRTRHLWPLREVFLDSSAGSAVLESRPVVRLSFAINFAMGGLETFPYHLTNLVVHVLSGLTLFGIIRRTLALPGLRHGFNRAATPLALAVSLLWSLHPLQTAAVTYVVQRYESMMGLFSLLALYSLIRCASSSRPRGWAVASVAASLLALGCKEVAVALPLCILLYDRAFLAGSFRAAWNRRHALYLGLGGALAGFAALQFLAAKRSAWAGYDLPISWLAYARTQPGVILHYLRLAIWPQPLVFDYHWPVARSAGEILPGVVVIGGLAAMSSYALVRRPKAGFLGGWFFLILAPTSSIMPIADLAFLHRMYLPLAAIAVTVVLAVYACGEGLVRRGLLSERAAASFGIGLLVLSGGSLAIKTWQRNLDFSSALSIWTDTVAKAPDNARAHVLLGQALAATGNPDAAAAEYRRALEIVPNYAEALNALGSVLGTRGAMKEAVALYRQALRTKPLLTDAHFNLGVALAALGDTDAAIEHFNAVLRANPRDSECLYDLGKALLSKGLPEEALMRLDEAVALNPGQPAILFARGEALARLNRLPEAVEDLRKVLELDPGNAEARATLEHALRALQR